MKVADLHRHELYTAQAEESLDAAADRMNWHQVGALPVFQGQRLVGIITERDLTAALAEGADPVTTLVVDYMTPAGCPSTTGQTSGGRSGRPTPVTAPTPCRWPRAGSGTTCARSSAAAL